MGSLEGPFGCRDEAAAAVGELSKKAVPTFKVYKKLTTTVKEKAKHSRQVKQPMRLE